MALRRALPPPNAALLTIGTLLVVAALVGGNVEGAGNKLPPVTNPWIRLVLGVIGVGLIAVSFLISPSSGPAVPRSARGALRTRAAYKLWDLRDDVAPAVLDGQAIPGDAVMVTDVVVLEGGEKRDVEASFTYSSRFSICGRSVSHPGAPWIPFRGEKGNTAHTLTIDVPRRDEAHPVVVVNEVAFFGGWRDGTEQDVVTLIDRPTKDLAMILVFPRDRRCVEAYGEVNTDVSRPWQRLEPENGPRILQHGTLVHWSPVTSDQPDVTVGTQFRLAFHW
jgi:hypothetical protein